MIIIACLSCCRLLTKKKSIEEHKKKIAESESIIATKSDLLKEVDSLLTTLGNEPAPKALDLPDMTGDNLVSLQLPYQESWETDWFLNLLPSQHST